MTKSPAAAALDPIVADVHEPGLKVVLMPTAGSPARPLIRLTQPR